MSQNFASAMKTLERKLLGFRRFEDFVKFSLETGKNNFYLEGAFDIIHPGKGGIGNSHRYHIRAGSTGYRHRTKLNYHYPGVWKPAFRDADNKIVIDWEPDYGKMVREMQSAESYIRDVFGAAETRAFVNKNVKSKVIGVPYSSFDEGSAGFIS